MAERFRAFYRDVLPPWATLVVETFEAQLLDPEPAWMDRLVRFDFKDKLRGEPMEQANALKILVEGGMITRDEAREELGKPPAGGNADELTVNANNQAALDALETRPPEDRTVTAPAVESEAPTAPPRQAPNRIAHVTGVGGTRWPKNRPRNPRRRHPTTPRRQEEQRVPYARFEEVNKRAKQAERDAQDLRERLLQFEDRDKSEVERERDARVRLEQRLTQLETENVAMQKGSWIRSAAAEANFHDPEDAFSLLRDQLGGFEDERDARKAVQRIAQQKKHLVKGDEKQQRSPVSALFQGQGVKQDGQGQQQRRQLSPAEQAQQVEMEQAESLAKALGEFRESNSNWRTLKS